MNSPMVVYPPSIISSSTADSLTHMPVGETDETDRRVTKRLSLEEYNLYACFLDAPYKRAEIVHH